MRILIGADPELFTRSRQTGLFVSGHNMLKGTKKRPMPVEFGALQVDGTALEFNIDPAATCDEFVNNIAQVRRQMAEKVAPFEVDIVAEPVAEFTPEYFRTIPRKALELGCNPDFNAYTLEANPVPDGSRQFRTGSGHVHIGWGEGFDATSADHFMACVELVRQLDYYLGLPSLLWDTDNRRRELYGKAGAFRPKSYGVEYRVPSNVWLRDERTQRFVFDTVMQAVNDLMIGKNMGAEYGNLAQQLIDGNVTDWYKEHNFDIGSDYMQFAAAA
jgi:hypothetical protein